MTSDKLWWPHCYVDEVCPEGKDSPDAWLTLSAAGDPQLAAADQDPEQPWGKPVPLQFGSIQEFTWCLDLGDIEVTVNTDGSFTAAHDPNPAAAHFWADGNPDTLQGSLESFAKSWAEDASDLPETVLVQTAMWGDASFRLVPNEGKPKFQLVTAHEAGEA
jgi:hypothetical protein